MPRESKSARPETVAIHAGRDVDPASGAVVPPIHVSTTFERAPDGTYPHGHSYSRESSPNRSSLETCIAGLEGGAAAVAFASGSAAVLAVCDAIGSGGHLIATYDSYHGTLKQLDEVVQRWGLEVTLVDTTDIDAVRDAITPNTRLLWIETPSNPLLAISDISALSEIAHAGGATVACDNTFATPILQNPIQFGADFVMHSTTKYIGGHSDVVGGIVVAAKDGQKLDRLRRYQTLGGATPSAFDCWLIRRSICTLPYRIRAHCDNAIRIAEFLEQHEYVERVYYPGLPSHDGHQLAARQMSGFGGMLSFCVSGGQTEALAVTNRLQLIFRATSLGGVESLIEHRASIEGPNTRAPDNLLRLSVGLEHADDLIADLDQALKQTEG